MKNIKFENMKNNKHENFNVHIYISKYIYVLWAFKNIKLNVRPYLCSVLLSFVKKRNQYLLFEFTYACFHVLNKSLKLPLFTLKFQKYKTIESKTTVTTRSKQKVKSALNYSAGKKLWRCCLEFSTLLNYKRTVLKYFGVIWQTVSFQKH